MYQTDQDHLNTQTSRLNFQTNKNHLTNIQEFPSTSSQDLNIFRNNLENNGHNVLSSLKKVYKAIRDEYGYLTHFSIAGGSNSTQNN